MKYLGDLLSPHLQARIRRQGLSALGRRAFSSASPPHPLVPAAEFRPVDKNINQPLQEKTAGRLTGQVVMHADDSLHLLKRGNLHGAKDALQGLHVRREFLATQLIRAAISGSPLQHRVVIPECSMVQTLGPPEQGLVFATRIIPLDSYPSEVTRKDYGESMDAMLKPLLFQPFIDCALLLSVIDSSDHPGLSMSNIGKVVSGKEPILTGAGDSPSHVTRFTAVIPSGGMDNRAFTTLAGKGARAMENRLAMFDFDFCFGHRDEEGKLSLHLAERYYAPQGLIQTFDKSRDIDESGKLHERAKHLSHLDPDQSLVSQLDHDDLKTAIALKFLTFDHIINSPHLTHDHINRLTAAAFTGDNGEFARQQAHIHRALMGRSESARALQEAAAIFMVGMDTHQLFPSAGAFMQLYHDCAKHLPTMPVAERQNLIDKSRRTSGLEEVAAELAAAQRQKTAVITHEERNSPSPTFHR